VKNEYTNLPPKESLILEPSKPSSAGNKKLPLRLGLGPRCRAEQASRAGQGRAGWRSEAAQGTFTQGSFTKGGGVGQLQQGQRHRAMVQFGCSSATVLVVLVTLVGWDGPFACFSSPAKLQPSHPPCLIGRLITIRGQFGGGPDD
jgi:hypothetical protein